MSAQAAPKTCTLEDYLARQDEYPRYELLEGELVEMVSPTARHQRISREVFRALDDHCRRHQLGEVFFAPLDVILSRTVVVQPDLFFISAGRRRALVGERITGAPDLVVEVLSPATSARDLNQKRRLYARHGVAEYWIVDPESETIEVQRLQAGVLAAVALYEGEQALISPGLPGLSLPLRTVFAVPAAE